MASTSKRYPTELQDRVVRTVAGIRSEHGSEWAAVGSVAEKLGIGTAQTVQNWVRRADVDAGKRPGVLSEAAEELPKLRSENRELKRASEILKSASTFSAAELGRHRTSGITRYVVRESALDSAAQTFALLNRL